MLTADFSIWFEKQYASCFMSKSLVYNFVRWCFIVSSIKKWLWMTCLIPFRFHLIIRHGPRCGKNVTFPVSTKTDQWKIFFIYFSEYEMNCDHLNSKNVSLFNIIRVYSLDAMERNLDMSVPLLGLSLE